MHTKRLVICLVVVTLLALLVLPGIVAAGPSTNVAIKATPVGKPLLPAPKPLLKVDPPGPAKLPQTVDSPRPAKPLLEPGPTRQIKSF